MLSVQLPNSRFAYSYQKKAEYAADPITYISNIVVTQSYFRYSTQLNELWRHSQTYIYIGYAPVNARPYNHDLGYKVMGMNSMPVHLYLMMFFACLGRLTSTVCRSFLEMKYSIPGDLTQENVGLML